MPNHYEIRKTKKGFEIIGPPEGSRVYLLDTKSARQFKKIRLAEQILLEAKRILDEGNSTFSKDNLLMREATAIAASTRYFSVFQSGGLGLKLDANQVFKDMPDALERHNDWRRIRDERFNHPAEVGRTMETCLIYDLEDEFYDVVTFILDHPVGQNH